MVAAWEREDGKQRPAVRLIGGTSVFARLLAAMERVVGRMLAHRGKRRRPTGCFLQCAPCNAPHLQTNIYIREIQKLLQCENENESYTVEWRTTTVTVSGSAARQRLETVCAVRHRPRKAVLPHLHTMKTHLHWFIHMNMKPKVKSQNTC